MNGLKTSELDDAIEKYMNFIVYTEYRLLDSKAIIRLERQEYPRKTLADAIQEKLYNNNTGAGG